MTCYLGFGMVERQFSTITVTRPSMFNSYWLIFHMILIPLVIDIC